MLCACAPNEEESSVPVSSSKVQTSVSQSEEDEPPLPFSETDFLSFFDDVYYGTCIYFPVNSTADIQDSSRVDSVVELMISYVMYRDEQNGTETKIGPEGLAVVPIDILQSVSQDMFGFTYDFADAKNNIVFQTSEEGALRFPGAHELFVSAEVDRDSFKYEDGTITVQADLTSVSVGSAKTPIGTATYVFTNMPENEYCPYQLISVEISGAPNGTTSGQAQSEVMPPEHRRFQAEGKPPYIVNADGGLNMRTGPGTEYESIMLIPNGELLTPIGGLEAGSDWEYVSYNGVEGWINRQYAPLAGV